MLDKIKSIPEKVAMVIGLTLILFSPIFLFLMSLLFPFGIWTMILIEVIVCFFAIIFILSAADKRQLRIGKTK
jgi:hypothetical protein